MLNKSRFSSPWVGQQANDSSLEKHFQEGTVETQISPLRCASVEMTKGSASRAIVAEQEPFFNTLGGPQTHDSLVETSQRQALAPILNAQLDGNPDQLRKGIRLHFTHYLASMNL